MIFKYSAWSHQDADYQNSNHYFNLCKKLLNPSRGGFIKEYIHNILSRARLVLVPLNLLIIEQTAYMDEEEIGYKISRYNERRAILSIGKLEQIPNKHRPVKAKAKRQARKPTWSDINFGDVRVQPFDLLVNPPAPGVYVNPPAQNNYIDQVRQRMHEVAAQLEDAQIRNVAANVAEPHIDENVVNSAVRLARDGRRVYGDETGMFASRGGYFYDDQY